MTERTDERHAEKMKKKQAAHEKIMASKTVEKGLLIVHTGKGKGKTTAALVAQGVDPVQAARRAATRVFG